VQPVEGVGAVKFWIEAELGAPRAFADVGGRAALDEIAIGEEILVDLGAHLQGVAAVDEDRGPVLEHDRRPGRASEAGQPGQAVECRGYVLILPFVLVRHDHAVEAEPRQRFAQERQVLATKFGAAGDFESLDHDQVSGVGCRVSCRVSDTRYAT
jgi:hypothetical protein